mmetsp:Transcript_43557/g.70086  ORF Transcript_43557/g.70086 Transcript_43557/m.70086 type:complete len:94 (+) Transcript_43557:1608-1889(+)
MPNKAKAFTRWYRRAPLTLRVRDVLAANLIHAEVDDDVASGAGDTVARADDISVCGLFRLSLCSRPPRNLSFLFLSLSTRDKRKDRRSAIKHL